MRTVKAKKTSLLPLMLRACTELRIVKELAGCNPTVIAMVAVHTSMVVEGVVKEGEGTKSSEGGIRTSGTRAGNSQGTTSSKSRDHCLLIRWTTVPIARKTSNRYHSDREMAAAILVRIRLLIGPKSNTVITCRWSHNRVIFVLIFTVILYCLIVFLCT